MRNRERLGVSLFIYLFVCWSRRMTTLFVLLIFYYTTPLQDGVGAGAECQVWESFQYVSLRVSLNRPPLAMGAACPVTLHSALLCWDAVCKLEVVDCTIEL